MSLNKKEKEELVIKLHQENKTIRHIAEIVHMSFKDISTIIKRIEGQANDDTNVSNKSKATQALYLFEQGKKPIEISIQLDISYSELVELQEEFWALRGMYDLALAYLEIKNDLSSFPQLFKLLRQRKMLSEKHISKLLRYAVFDLPSLESKVRNLRSEIIELEFKKRDLIDTLKIQNAQLLDLGQTIVKFQTITDSKKYRLLS